ncbi:MAG: hypothetical protein AAB606_05120 [Patescibacteria group bacterium]
MAAEQGAEQTKEVADKPKAEPTTLAEFDGFVRGCKTDLGKCADRARDQLKKAEAVNH